MKNLTRILISTLTLLFLCSGYAAAAPKILNVTLQQHTTITANIVPTLGTRFIFPFVLDDADEFVPYTAELTNPSFLYKREPGRNSFVISIPPNGAGQTANLFVTVAGYLVTIELTADKNRASSYSDISFVLGNAERENLIQKGVAQRTKALEAEYKKKGEELNAVAEKKAISLVGALALSKPSYNTIKEETKTTLTNGDKIVLYVDEAVTYGPYTIFKFELSLENSIDAVSILDAKLLSINPDNKSERPVDASKNIPDRLTQGKPSRGIITTLNSTLNPKEYLKLQVHTNRGNVEAKW